MSEDAMVPSPLARGLLEVVAQVIGAKLATELGRPVLARRRVVEASESLARLRPRLDTAAAASDDTDDDVELADLLGQRWPRAVGREAESMDDVDASTDQPERKYP